MRKVIKRKVRDTDKMTCVIRNDGGFNNKNSTYQYIMLDERDGTHYLWSGHFFSGVGKESLQACEDLLNDINDWHLSKAEAEYVNELLDRAGEEV